MASVYVSGDDARSLVQFADTDATNAHSYYGMGCPNTWGNQGAGGSDIPCSTRIVSTVNDGDQKNGTLYTFNALTSGTGGAIFTDNTNSDDTFCPLGWQLPYSGTGGNYYDKSKSWNYLYTTYNIAFNDGTASDVAKVRSYPISYIYSGFFAFHLGRLYRQGNGGDYWSITTAAYYEAYSLSIRDNYLKTSNDTDGKTYAYPLRCVGCFYY